MFERYKDGVAVKVGSGSIENWGLESLICWDTDSLQFSDKYNGKILV